MAPSDLSARIRADVEQGRPRDEIVKSLLERGLSPASAERFVDRAVAAHEAGPMSPPAPAPSGTDDDEEDRGGRGSLIAGAFWLSVGCSVTGITYLVAKPGGKYMVMYGAVVAGLVAFGRGLKRFLDAGPAPFPWKAVAIAALVPLLGMAGLVGFVKGRAASRRAAAERMAEQAAETVKQAREAEARAEEQRAQAEADVARATRMDQERSQERVSFVNRNLKLLRNPGTGWTGVCDAALALGRSGVREAIPDLQARLRDASDGGLQGCAATGLVALGEIDEPMAFYVASSQGGNEDLRRGAIMGFGNIGPRAAAAALPFLGAEAQSPDSTHRYLAVEALSKMGPEAAPLLRGALNDSDPLVKTRATAALAAMGVH